MTIAHPCPMWTKDSIVLGRAGFFVRVPVMEEPSLRTSRQAIALGTLVALLLGGVGFFVGRGTGPAPDSLPTAQPEPIVTPPAELLTGPLMRADLLWLAGTAADAFAGGGPSPEALQTNAGRRFDLRLPFGCGGPAPANAASGWTYDERSGTLRVFTRPERWNATEWADGDEAAIERIEGFWIDRPWTSSENCPPLTIQPVSETEAAGGVEAETPAPAALPALAIGQIYTRESARGGRREGDAFQTVARVTRDALNTSQGFRLRLRGRLTNAIGAQPVACRAESSAQRPVCLITVTIDEAAIENPATGQTLATWNLSQRDSTSAN